jgi:hypothetical protein
MRLSERSARIERGREARRCAAIGSFVCAVLLLFATAVKAEEDPAGLFREGSKALHEGRAGDAVAAFEALADRGFVDAAASLDRGLAYAMRVRMQAEVPGDLGRAAHAFEEARDLASDPRIADEATRALGVVRSEIARRRMRAGQPAAVDPGRSLGRTLAGLLSEDTWAFLSIAMSVALAAGLFLRWLGTHPRLRIAGGVTAGVAAPAMAIAITMTLATRNDRLNTREAVVVSAGARATDERGIALQGATALPEGARVEIVDARGAQTRVRFGTQDTWIATGTLREIARRE